MRKPRFDKKDEEKTELKYVQNGKKYLLKVKGNVCTKCGKKFVVKEKVKRAIKFCK